MTFPDPMVTIKYEGNLSWYTLFKIEWHWAVIYISLFLITKLHGKEIDIKNTNICTCVHQFPKGSKQINIKSIAIKEYTQYK